MTRTALQTLRVGFLGVGAIARDHAQALAALGHSIVAGCATGPSSPRWKRFLETAPEAKFIEDGEALLADPQVDAIIACLPWQVTETWLPKIFSTDKPVLIEKPAALSSEVLAQALSAPGAKTQNKRVGLNRRFYGTVQQLRARITEGGVKAVEVTISEPAEALAHQYGSGVLKHLLAYSSCHILDAARHVFGTLTPVQVSKHPEPRYEGACASIHALLEAPKGVPVWLSILIDNPAPVGIRVFFEDGTTWHLSPIERLTVYKGYERLDPEPGMRVPRYRPIPIKTWAEEGEIRPGFLEQAKAFLQPDGQGLGATLQEYLDLLHWIESIEQAG